ncbi:hypothetical protein BDB00DRAFT_760754 [Zychaea mexicana]|uniref:uncharacterized protein n=1 Tax=Zychaea mexicana TaxID=64656 RepID=UPI0022FE57F4|nr:uncharacterized protein BDB00DRAFT_760754 [Zychaea mexicana]KAI9495127.1 hypothetical protein BDB00DRAFT_760754 [Zychaea mexicana]
MNREPTQLGIRITAGVLTTALACHLLVVRFVRYRYINKLKRKYPDPSIALRDFDVAEEVFHITSRREFPSLELALFRTYAVPTISRLLFATGEFSKNTSKRAEDTELILLELADAYSHIELLRKGNRVPTQEEIDEQRQRPKDALARLNEIHGKYPILNGDYLYTLSLFIVEPIKWAIFRLWYEIGKRMNLKDIPPTVQKMIEFNKKYARENVHHATTNWKVGKPTVEHLLGRFPKFLHPILSPIVFGFLPALLEPVDVAGFGLKPAHASLITLVSIGFHIRAFFIRHCMLPRYTTVLRTPLKPDPKTKRYKPLYNMYDPTYPDGYCIFELGPDKYKPMKCPIPH